MQDNLNDLIEKNVNLNERVLKRSKKRYNNQELKETNLKRKFKKVFLYGSILSIIGPGIYGGNHYWHEYKNYITEQNKKIVLYQKRFNKIKKYYDSRNFIYADKLSEKLQNDMGKESFLSPTNSLYSQVKEYDNKFIDPEIKRLKRERLKRKMEKIPSEIKEKWDETYENLKFRWVIATQKERTYAIFGSIISFVLLCKILFRKKK